jgi:hypothetical protein
MFAVAVELLEFRSANHNLAWGLDTDADLTPVDLDDCDNDLVTDHETF